jgi:phosphatidylglycerol:prolipoprotein diacylglycerol transferase
VQFPKGSPPWLAERAQKIIPADATHSLPLHPTQIYAAIDGLMLFLLLTAFYPLRRRDGEVVGVLMLAYPVTRFVVEALRDDEAPLVAGLSIAQVVSLFLFSAALMFWAWLDRRPAYRVVDAIPSEAPASAPTAADA